MARATLPRTHRTPIVGETQMQGRFRKRPGWYAGLTTKVAWFFQRPLYAPDSHITSIHDIVGRHDFYCLSGSDTFVASTHPDDDDTLTAFDQFVALGMNPDFCLQYINAPNISIPEDGCIIDPTYSGFTTSWVSRSNDFCSRVDPNEDWFCHRGGNRIIAEGDGWCAMDVGNTGFQDYCADKVAEIHADYGEGGLESNGTYGFRMAGLLLDNVWSNEGTHENNAGGPIDEYAASPASDAAWQAGYKVFLTKIRDAIRAVNPRGQVWINPGGTDPSVYVDEVDGIMFETWMTNWNGWEKRSQEEVEFEFAVVDELMAKNKGALIVPQGNSNSDHELMQYAHAGYLMVAHKSGRCFFRFQNGVDYRRFWDFPEFQYDLGAPLEDRTPFPSGRGYQRKFQRGLALVNIHRTDGEANYNLQGSYYKPDGTGPISTLTLPPQSGITLRKAI